MLPVAIAFVRAMVQGQTIVEFDNRSKGAEAIKGIWKNVVQQLGI